MANIEDVYNRLGTVDNKMDTIIKWSGAVDERCKNHLQQTSELQNTLYKNDSGVVARVTRLWNGRKAAAKWKDWSMRVLGTLVAVSIISFVCWLLFIYKKI